ncbi:hypothetical protein ACUXI4_004446 [Pantoea piersonii]|jgi:hypothetical protein
MRFSQSVRVALAWDRSRRNRSEELFVKYALMGISFFVLLWVGTFVLMM